MSFAENCFACPNFGAFSGLSPARANELAARPPTMRPATMKSLRFRTISPPFVACRPARQSPAGSPVDQLYGLRGLAAAADVVAHARRRDNALVSDATVARAAAWTARRRRVLALPAPGPIAMEFREGIRRRARLHTTRRARATTALCPTQDAANAMPDT